MAEDTVTKSTVEKVFESLSKQDRLDLLERLIRGEAESDNDAPTSEEHVERMNWSGPGEGCGCRHGSEHSSSRGRRGCGCG